MYLQPRTELGIWFHDLPPPPTICGAVVTTNASTTPAGMAMAIEYGSAQGEYETVTTLAVGTC